MLSERSGRGLRMMVTMSAMLLFLVIFIFMNSNYATALTP